MKAIVHDKYGSPDVPRLKDIDEPAERLAVPTDLIEAGKVRPVIDRTYPLSEVPEAIRYVGEGHAQGKIVITV